LAILAVLTCSAQGDWRETEIDGRRIRYQVIDGEAIWQGDIVLGPVESLGKGARASAVLSGQRFRWTSNVIPYIIADDVPEKARVEGAIQHWNTKTPIRMVPHSNEANYIEFRRRTTGSCSSSVGMIGGRQFINLPDNCSLGSVIHEIGHAVGIYHTQSREDRDLFIRVRESSIEPASLSQYAVQSESTDDIGAYPYDSIMHYSVSGFALPSDVAMETLPSGIPLGQRAGLSASDIDTIVRMHGGQPARTTISSNPEGIDVIVDGQTVRTPAAFDWPAGSRHTVSVNDVAIEGADLWFGRWSDFGDRTHTVIASPDTTVFTVHMRRMYKIPLTAAPANGGDIVMRPSIEGGFVPDGQLVELEAFPAFGFTFTNWTGFGYFAIHGSANPIRFTAGSPDLNYIASFSRNPVTTVTSSPPGLRLVADGAAFTTPRQFVWAEGTRHDISVEATSQTSLGGGAMHTWSAWSDDGAQRHTVTAGANGDTFTARFDTRYQVLTTTSPGASGRIAVEPPLTSGFAPAGSSLSISAIPIGSNGFAGWSGTAPGGPAQKVIPVNGILDLRAEFAQPNTLTSAALLNAATYRPGSVAPGEILTLFGLDLGPEQLAGLTLTPQRRIATTAGGVRVLFDNTPAPVLYASSRQVGVVVPFDVAGKANVRIQLQNGSAFTNLLTVPVAAAAPGFFTIQQSGRGLGAFLNSDGSLNSETNPAARGSIVVLYATGLGAMTPALADGELAAPPYARPVTPFKVRIGDQECEVLYGGAAPSLVAGLIQLNVRIPAVLGPGILPVTLEAAGLVSPRTVGIAVR